MTAARPDGDIRWFLAWALPGALIGVSLVGAAGLGLLISPLALIALIVVIRRAPKRADPWGLLLGFGIAALGFGILYLEYYAGSCPESDRVERLPNGGVRIESCEPIPPLPFLAAGVVLAAVAMLGYRHSRRSSAR